MVGFWLVQMVLVAIRESLLLKDLLLVRHVLIMGSDCQHRPAVGCLSVEQFVVLFLREAVYLGYFVRAWIGTKSSGEGNVQIWSPLSSERQKGFPSESMVRWVLIFMIRLVESWIGKVEGSSLQKDKSRDLQVMVNKKNHRKHASIITFMFRSHVQIGLTRHTTGA